MRQADAPKNRGIVRDKGQEAADRFNNYVNCSISQWGVGAKSAGFYLGTSIKVVTCAGDDDVHEVELSAKEMETKHERTGNGFNTMLNTRKRGDLDSCSFKQEALNTHDEIRRVMQEELKPDCRHFSRFLITTDTPSEFQLRTIRGWQSNKDEQRGQDIIYPLADVYYRLLHGPYGEGNGSLNNKAEWMCPTISLAYFSQASRRWNVADLRDVHNNAQSQYMKQHQGAIFRCEVEFTPPQTESDVPAGERCVARVEVLYYPKKWEGETHPDLMEAAQLEEERLEQKEEESKSDRRRVAARGGLAQSLQQPQEQQLSADDEKDSRVLETMRRLRSNKKVCSQFWNGRLIPAEQDKLLWFMEFPKEPELREAHSRIHYSIFFCYPVLTDRVKLHFRQNLINWINTADSPEQPREEYIVDSRGQSKKIARSGKKLRDLFREQVREWVQLDENYFFGHEDFIERLSIEEKHAHFSQVRLSSNKWVKQASLQLVNVKGAREPTFIRVLCIQQSINTQEYLERQRRDVASHGSVIGYLEPRTREDGAYTNPFKFNHGQSLQSLLRAEPIRSLPAVDLKLASFRLKQFALKQVNKQISEDELRKQYQQAVKKAAETYPTRIAVYVLPLREAKSGEEMQLRVSDCFPASSVLALTDKLDEDQLPVPVGGEKVKQCTYKLMDEPSRQRPLVKEEKEPADDKRRGAKSSNVRAGQLASRQRIPRVVPHEEKEERAEEIKQSEPEFRVTSSGRIVRPTQHVMSDVMQEERSQGKRRAASAGGGQRKKKRVDDSQRSGAADEEVEDMDVEEEVMEVRPSSIPRALVQAGEWKADVCSALHAAALLRNELNGTEKALKGFQEKRFHVVGLHQVEYTMLPKVDDGPPDRDHVEPVTINVRVFPGTPHVIDLATARSAQPVSLRLGQRSNEGVRLSIEDKWHNPITPSAMRGWKGGELCSFRLWCEEYPQLKVSADGDKLLPHEPKDQYQIVGLKIEPSEEKVADELMVDFDGDHRGRLLTCCIQFTVPAVSREADEAETILVKYKVRLLPGEPQRLEDDFPEQLELTNSETFPEFTLQYKDAFGKPAALTDEQNVPLVSVWCDDERVEEWVAERIAVQPMQSNGSFKSTALQLPPFFVQPQALANIMTTNRQLEEQRGVHPDQRSHGYHSFAVHLQVEAAGEVKLHKECHVRLLPRSGPSFLLVGHSKDDDVHIDTPLEVKAQPNDVLSLLLHGIDDAGYILSLENKPDEPESGWRSDLPPSLRKAIRVNISGLVNLLDDSYQCGLNELDESGLLPRVKMPKRIDGRQLECDVSVEFDEARLPDGATEGMTDEQKSVFEDYLDFVRTRLPLTCTFVIHVQPGKPCQWSASVPSSIRCNTQWSHRVQLFAVDKYSNRVSVPKSMPPPRVSVMAVIPQADENGLEQAGQARVEMSDSMVQQDVQPQRSVDGRNEAKDAESDDEDAYQPVVLESAEAVGVAEGGGDDDDVMVDEWTHFVCEKAYVVMRAGPASLTVCDDKSVLLRSNSISFMVEPGVPKAVRVWLKDRTTGELTRIGNTKLRRPRHIISMHVEGQEAEAIETITLPFVLPVRMKFDQLVVSWLDRAKNIVIPDAHQRSHLALRIENAALFELPDGGALQQEQRHSFWLKAQNELQGEQSVFPPFVCIYSKGADTLELGQQWRAEDMSGDDEDYAGMRMHLRVGITSDNEQQPARPLCNIELGLCTLPYSIEFLLCITVYTGDEADGGQALLNPAVFSNLKMEEQQGSDTIIMAGIAAPIVQVRLPRTANRSSLHYTLPPPDPSSLSLEWAYEGERCLLQYQPAVYEEKEEVYLFRPVVQERKEGEQAALVAQGEGIAPVGRFGLLDKAGKWSYCVTYTEKRPRLADVLTNRVMTHTVDENILPSLPHSLRVQRSEASSVTMPIVSNSESGNRIIGRDIHLFIVDKYGSAVHLPLMSDALRAALRSVRCVVQSIDDHPEGGEQAVRQRTAPQLRVEQPVLNFQLHCLDIPAMTVVDAVDNGKEADSGQYAVAFSLPEPYNAQFQCSLRFFFSNEKQLLEERRAEEQRRSVRRQQLSQLLTQAQATARALRGELELTGQSITSLQRWQHTLVEDEDGVLITLHSIVKQVASQQLINIDVGTLTQQLQLWRTSGALSSASVAHPFIDLDQQLTVAYNALISRQMSLPAVLHDRRHINDPLTQIERDTPLDRQQDGYYGMLASFCTIEDEKVCQLLSWHFGRKLSSYLVRDRTCNAKLVLEANARRLGITVSVIYEEGQPRLMQARPPLPHTRLPAAVHHTIGGRPIYVYDLLHFPERDEQLRQLQQRVIQRQVGHAMLMLSMDDIRHYRQLLAHHGIPAPDILALKELKPLYSDNREQLGSRTTAPQLHLIIPRMGVQTVAVQQLSEAVRQLQEKVARVNQEVGEVKQQWAANGWIEKERLQRQTLAAAEQQRAQLEAELSALAGQVGQQDAAVAPAANVPLSSAASHRHRRRQAGHSTS